MHQFFIVKDSARSKEQEGMSNFELLDYENEFSRSILQELRSRLIQTGMPAGNIGRGKPFGNKCTFGSKNERVMVFLHVHSSNKGHELQGRIVCHEYPTLLKSLFKQRYGTPSPGEAVTLAIVTREINDYLKGRGDIEFRNRLKDDCYCPRCDYDLTGNESGICPECGYKVSPPSRRETPP